MRRRIAFGALTLIFAGAAATALFWPKPALANSPCDSSWGPSCDVVCTVEACQAVCGETNCRDFGPTCTLHDDSYCDYHCWDGRWYTTQCVGACEECDGGGEPGGSPVFARKPTPK